MQPMNPGNQETSLYERPIKKGRNYLLGITVIQLFLSLYTAFTGGNIIYPALLFLLTASLFTGIRPLAVVNALLRLAVSFFVVFVGMSDGHMRAFATDISIAQYAIILADVAIAFFLLLNRSIIEFMYHQRTRNRPMQ